MNDAAHAERLLAPVWRPVTRGWWLAFAVAAAGTALLGAAVAYTIATGIGVWGTDWPVAWAFAIVNFVWWIGIGHAGTFISAILLLLEQPWRSSVSRIAEAMTIFAVLQAALFPLLHLGRPWFAYWLAPYPARTEVWPQWKSALPWDAAAITTYFTVSVLFWYLGMIPDLAALRDRAPGRARPWIYGVLALGWRGGVDARRHHRAALLLLAGLATPLVVSVHSIVSSDFASGIVGGWHSTIFPPFFVAGAIFSGFAMVLTLLLPARRVLGLHDVITARHLDAIAKLLLATGWIVFYSYVIEQYFRWYGDEPARRDGLYWLTVACNVAVPQIFWWRRARRSAWTLWIASLAIHVGMWCERFVIVIRSLERDHLPSAWGSYAPTWVDWSLLGGTISLFALLFLLFLKFLPVVPVEETRAVP